LNNVKSTSVQEEEEAFEGLRKSMPPL